MSRKIHSVILVSLALLTSIAVMIVPSYFTRGISRTEVNKKIDLPLLLNDDKKVKLVFFGYSGCQDICTPRLHSLSKFYNALDKETKKKFGVTFIDISNPLDKSLPSRFATYFNPDFKGLFLDKKSARLYARAFDVFFSKSLLDKHEYNHTSNLYLVTKKNRHKRIRYIYTAYPYDYKQIKSDIQRLLNG